jgi:hypothetical protein
LVEFFNKPILRKEFSFFNTSSRFQRLQSRAIAQGHLVPAADCLRKRDLHAAIDEAGYAALKGRFFKGLLAVWSVAITLIMILVGDLLEAVGVSPRAWWWRRCVEALLLLVTITGATVYAIAREARSVLHKRLPTVICECGYYLNNMVARCPECGEAVPGSFGIEVKGNAQQEHSLTP